MEEQKNFEDVKWNLERKKKLQKIFLKEICRGAVVAKN